MSDRQVRKARLSRSADFERVYRHGRSAQHRLLVMYRFERPDDIRGDEDGDCRIGITVSRRLGGAVERNRLKRQLREAVGQASVLVEGHDLVLIARPGLPEYIESQGFDELVDLVAGLARQLGAAAPAAGQEPPPLADDPEPAGKATLDAGPQSDPAEDPTPAARGGTEG